LGTDSKDIDGVGVCSIHKNLGISWHFSMDIPSLCKRYCKGACVNHNCSDDHVDCMNLFCYPNPHPLCPYGHGGTRTDPLHYSPRRSAHSSPSFDQYAFNSPSSSLVDGEIARLITSDETAEYDGAIARLLADGIDIDDARRVIDASLISSRRHTKPPPSARTIEDLDATLCQMLQLGVTHEDAQRAVYGSLTSSSSPCSSLKVSAHGESRTPRQTEAAAITRTIAENVKRAQSQRAPPHLPSSVNLSQFTSHSQNVHNQAVETPAFATLDQLLHCHPQSRAPGEVIQAVISRIKSQGDIPAPTRSSAVEELKSPSTLNCQHTVGNVVLTFTQALCAVWGVIERHKDGKEMTKVLAQEIVDGRGKCAGGKIGRLCNSMRGFVDIGFDVSESNNSEAFQSAFGLVAMAEGLSSAEKRRQAEAVLDEYGVIGQRRADFLAHLEG
jgi:hypothetical protein